MGEGLLGWTDRCRKFKKEKKKGRTRIKLCRPIIASGRVLIRVFNRLSYLPFLPKTGQADRLCKLGSTLNLRPVRLFQDKLAYPSLTRPRLDRHPIGSHGPKSPPVNV